MLSPPQQPDRRYVPRDDQWERIKDLLPGRDGCVGVTATDNRLSIEAVLYRYRAKLWSVTISDRTISRALKKIGFSRKKRMHTPSAGRSPTCGGFRSMRCTKQKLMDIEKEMKKKEES
jgi:transposase